MLHADDAGIVYKSAECLAKMMTVIEHVFKSTGLTVIERKTEPALLRTPNQDRRAVPLVKRRSKF